MIPPLPQAARRGRRLSVVWSAVTRVGPEHPEAIALRERREKKIDCLPREMKSEKRRVRLVPLWRMELPVQQVPEERRRWDASRMLSAPPLKTQEWFRKHPARLEPRATRREARDFRAPTSLVPAERNTFRWLRESSERPPTDRLSIHQAPSLVRQRLWAEQGYRAPLKLRLPVKRAPQPDRLHSARPSAVIEAQRKRRERNTSRPLGEERALPPKVQPFLRQENETTNPALPAAEPLPPAEVPARWHLRAKQQSPGNQPHSRPRRAEMRAAPEHLARTAHPAQQRTTGLLAAGWAPHRPGQRLRESLPNRPRPAAKTLPSVAPAEPRRTRWRVSR